MKEKDNKDRDEILNDDILPEELLRKAAEAISRQYAAEMDEMENDLVEVPEGLDRKILQMAREYDARHRREVRRKRGKTALRAAAVFAVVILGIGGIGMSTSEAFRAHVFSLFENRDDGAVVFRNDEEYELLKEWTDYWYPQYVPEGYYLLTAENNDLQKILLFSSIETAGEIRIYIKDEQLLSMVDIDTNIYEKTYINSYDGYIYFDDNNNSVDLIWQEDNRILEISISGSTEQELIIKIAESMKYIK